MQISVTALKYLLDVIDDYVDKVSDPAVTISDLEQDGMIVKATIAAYAAIYELNVGAFRR